MPEARNSLAILWLRIPASTAGVMGSIPGGGPQTLHTVWQPKKKKRQIAQFEKLRIE